MVREEVTWVVAHCRNCVLNRPSITRAPSQPIEVEKKFERVQIDLINMRHDQTDNTSGFFMPKTISASCPVYGLLKASRQQQLQRQ